MAQKHNRGQLAALWRVTTSPLRVQWNLNDTIRDDTFLDTWGNPHTLHQEWSGDPNSSQKVDRITTKSFSKGSRPKLEDVLHIWLSATIAKTVQVSNDLLKWKTETPRFKEKSTMLCLVMVGSRISKTGMTSHSRKCAVKVVLSTERSTQTTVPKSSSHWRVRTRWRYV